MSELETVMQAALTMADAIGRRDLTMVASLLAPDFLHRTPGGDASDAETFISAIQQIPGDIAFVKLESIRIDLCDGGALATGIQHARVRIDGQDVDDRRVFVDWFVKHAGEWKFRVAVDMPAPEEPETVKENDG
jgi:ketosteroid isomerase-like protein